MVVGSVAGLRHTGVGTAVSGLLHDQNGCAQGDVFEGTFCSVPEYGDKYHGYQKLADRSTALESNSIAFAVTKPICGTDSDVNYG